MDPLVLSLVVLLVSISGSQGSEMLGYGTKFGSQLDDSDRKNVIGRPFRCILYDVNGAEEAIFVVKRHNHVLFQDWEHLQLF